MNGERVRSRWTGISERQSVVHRPDDEERSKLKSQIEENGFGRHCEYMKKRMKKKKIV